jgi:hypothetical protein
VKKLRKTTHITSGIASITYRWNLVWEGFLGTTAPSVGGRKKDDLTHLGNPLLNISAIQGQRSEGSDAL